MNKLNAAKINCPKPLKNKNGKYLIERLFRKDIFDVSGFASKDGLEFTGGKFNLANYLKFIRPKHKSKSGIPVSVN